ncbi:hypothetical protein ACFL9T_16680 [Thermodesulfobacteriota bacterium]
MAEQAEKVDFFEGGEVIQNDPEAARYLDLINKHHRGRWRGEVNPVRTEVSDPTPLTKKIKETARELGADLIGISKMNQDFAYKGVKIPHSHAISLAMEMNYEAIGTSPSPESNTEVLRVYYELGETTLRLAEYIRELGYDAHSHHPLGGGGVLLVPLAIEAGLADEGRNGLGISRKFGPRFRSGCVTTDMPLLIDKPVDLGVKDFCLHCKACYNACPTVAIPESQALVRGHMKYTTDALKCRNFFNSNHGCAICIKVCVFNELSHQNKWLKTDKDNV